MKCDMVGFELYRSFHSDMGQTDGETTMQYVMGSPLKEGGIMMHY